ncbi:hypothetical protein LP419_26495 [Massilia sp. H-1]|nr:hypothetical protein LP419_26495 [Massilia sp. H-1]
MRALHFARDRTLWIGTESGVVTWNTGSDWDSRAHRFIYHPRQLPVRRRQRHGLGLSTLAAGLLRWDKGSSKATHYVHRANDSEQPAVRPYPRRHARPQRHAVDRFVHRRHQPGQPEQPGLPAFHSFRCRSAQSAAGQFCSSSSKARPTIASGWPAIRACRCSIRPTATCSRPGAPIPPSRVRSATTSSTACTSNRAGRCGSAPRLSLNRLDRMDKPVRVISFGSVGSDFINTIAPGKGDKLWLGTGNQVIHYDPAADTWINYYPNPNDPNSRSVNSTNVIVEDKQGRVWMGSEWSGGGLDVLDTATGKFRHLRHQPGNPASLADDNVVSLHEDPQGRLWVGTAKGLNQVITAADGSISFRNYRAKDSVGALKILSMRTDRQDMLWLSTVAWLAAHGPGHRQERALPAPTACPKASRWVPRTRPPTASCTSAASRA